MSSIRRVLRVFLASPGDLTEERKAIRQVVDEYNESLAGHFGYQIELLGWEDTVAGYGRPQHIINEEVGRCDLFLGMIWKRWGTPPDQDGRFSSGFQEEYERTIARRERSRSPEISLFIKHVSDDLIADPGDDLKRVLEFRKKIVSEKRLLFQNFSDTRNLEILARKCINSYVIRIKESDQSLELGRASSRRTQSDSDPDTVEARPGRLPVSKEGLAFLENLVVQLSEESSLRGVSAADIARFRLLANSLSKSGNHEMYVGVHDLNILYLARSSGSTLGYREVLFLARLALQNIDYQNAPFWCWYSIANKQDPRFDIPVLSSIYGATDEEKIGAISVLTALGRHLPQQAGEIGRRSIVDSWFVEGASVRLKSSALAYLSKCGRQDDYPTIKEEYDRSEQGTSRAALECMIAICLRDGPRSVAHELVLSSQFESLGEDTLTAVLESLKELSNEALAAGLEHRNRPVRTRALSLLLQRRHLTQEMAEKLCTDSDPLVRYKAMLMLTRLGRSFAISEVRRMLTAPELVGTGQKFVEQYVTRILRKYSESRLTTEIRRSLLDDTAYFVRAEKYPLKHVDELRRHVDDDFRTYFREQIRRIESLYRDMPGSNELLKRTRDLEHYYRRKLTRQGLDVLCRLNGRVDLDRIRKNLETDQSGTSLEDAKYMKKQGEWSDISLLSNAVLANYDLHREVATSLLHISHGRPVSDLFLLDLPTVILKNIVVFCPDSRFTEISADALLKLLGHDSLEVRRESALKAVTALPRKRLKSILDQYLDTRTNYHYNVIFWLDLGISAPQKDARTVARSART